jgi:hypothetical protein
VLAPLLLVLLQQASLVVRPMYLGEEPPPPRSARHILLRHRGALGSSPDRTRTREEALGLAGDLGARTRARLLRAGALAEPTASSIGYPILRSEK